MRPWIFAVATVSLVVTSTLSAVVQQAQAPPPPKNDVLVVEAIDVTVRPAPTPTASATIPRQPPITVPRSSVEPANLSAPPPVQAAAAPKLPAADEWKLKDIDADVRRLPGEWMLEIKFEVRQKSKTALSDAPATLIIALRESGAPVLNDDGTFFGFEIPLDRPKKAEKRKREFEGKLRASLGDTYQGDLETLEVFAWIELDQTGEKVAERTAEVDLHEEHAGIRGFGLSLFGFGGGVCW